MNKAVFKYELKNIRGVFILSLLFSFGVIAITSLAFKSDFQLMLMNGLYPNTSMVMDHVKEMAIIAMLGFSALAVIQVFMQFRQEKGQEIARFLKALPIKSEEYFITKLAVGILNITIGFLVLLIGVLLVRHMNMFWIKDYHSFSLDPNLFRKIDGIYNAIKVILFAYTIVLVFYTFIFMIQYKISNIFVASVSGILIWFAPYFIVGVSGMLLSKLGFSAMARSILFSGNVMRWLNPFIYILDYRSVALVSYSSDSYINNLEFIANMNLKFIILSLMILVNIVVAYKSAKSNLIEDEDKIIPRKLDRYIFILGVTLCSGLLAYLLLAELFGLRFGRIIILIIPILGGLLGCFVSKKIAFIGCSGRKS